MVSHLLFADCIRYLSCIPEEVEISTDITSRGAAISSRTKRVVVEVISRFLQLVPEPIVGVVEIEPVTQLSAVIPMGKAQNLLFLLFTLEGLKFSSLCETSEWITAIEYTSLRS
jgi:hypothetical protein